MGRKIKARDAKTGKIIEVDGALSPSEQSDPVVQKIIEIAEGT